MPLPNLRKLTSAFFSLQRPGQSIPSLIVEAPAQDPRLIAATRLAHQRFPEFLEAWARRKPDDHFSIKAAIPCGPSGAGGEGGGGGAEHMWFNVQAIQEGWIIAAADADGIDVPVKQGDLIKFKPTDIEDWFATAPNGDIIGGFTLHALAQIHADR